MPPISSSSGNPSTAANTHGIRLLALGALLYIYDFSIDLINWFKDGGGIRGLSELIILQEIMRRIQAQANLPQLPRPCDYFDLIGGTSTGGYINNQILHGNQANMSFRLIALECPVAECGRVFRARTTLTSHLRSHHPGYVEAPSIPMLGYAQPESDGEWDEVFFRPTSSDEAPHNKHRPCEYSYGLSLRLSINLPLVALRFTDDDDDGEIQRSESSVYHRCICN